MFELDEIPFDHVIQALLDNEKPFPARLVYRLFSILFTVVALWGALTILQLSRLRQAWLESVRAMNTMKDALIQQAPEMQDYFRWRTATIPKAYKPWSVGFLLALQVAMVSGIALGAASALFLLMAGVSNLTWILILVSVVVMLFYLVFLYYLPLRKSEKGA